jgi:hypothetical protein
VPVARGSGPSARRVKFRGRHWLILWMALFLGVAGAVITRQREGFQVARRLNQLRDRRNELQGLKAELEREIGLATSRQVLVPKMKAAGLHEPSDLENTNLKVDSLISGASRSR